MSGGISATTIAAVAGAAFTAYGALSQKAPQQPAVPALAKPPQASKTPDANAVRRKNATALTGPAAGNASTFLTGASGIEDNLLNLGKSTLLGQ